MVTFYLMVIVMFTLSVAVYEIFSVEIYMTLNLTFRISQRTNVNITIECQQVTLFYGDSDVCAM